LAALSFRWFGIIDYSREFSASPGGAGTVG